MSAHREPPDHPLRLLFEQRARDLGGGYCKVCAELIPRKDGEPNLTRAYCSDTCRRFADMAYSCTRPSRNAVRRAAYGECHDCRAALQDYEPKPGSKICHGWEADHIKPLALCDGHWRWFTLDNLCARCLDCHRNKTQSDMAQIRCARKARGTAALPLVSTPTPEVPDAT